MGQGQELECMLAGWELLEGLSRGPPGDCAVDSWLWLRGTGRTSGTQPGDAGEGLFWRFESGLLGAWSALAGGVVCTGWGRGPRWLGAWSALAGGMRGETGWTQRWCGG